MLNPISGSLIHIFGRLMLYCDDKLLIRLKYLANIAVKEDLQNSIKRKVKLSLI